MPNGQHITKLKQSRSKKYLKAQVYKKINSKKVKLHGVFYVGPDPIID